MIDVHCIAEIAFELVGVGRMLIYSGETLSAFEEMPEANDNDITRT